MADERRMTADSNLQEILSELLEQTQDPFTKRLIAFIVFYTRLDELTVVCDVTGKPRTVFGPVDVENMPDRPSFGLILNPNEPQMRVYWSDIHPGLIDSSMPSLKIEPSKQFEGNFGYELSHIQELLMGTKQGRLLIDIVARLESGMNVPLRAF